MSNPFKITLPSPKEKAKQLKEKFGDKSLDVVREIYQYGSIVGLREELMYLNSVESFLEGDFAEKVKEQFKRYQDYLIEGQNEEL